MERLTIIGRGDDWPECQFNTPELWGTATCLLTPTLRDKSFTKVFAFDGENFPEIKKSLEIARSRNIPIVGNLSFATEQYPLKDIAKRFRSSYFRNSISYMIAYALFSGYNRIDIFGIGGRKRWDYQQGKTYILFWLGVAAGMGVEVRVGQGSSRWLYESEKAPPLTNEELAAWHQVEL